KPHNVLRKDMRTLSRIQYADMWFTLNKNNNVAFPNRRRRAVALKVGIHKDIAKIFKISSPKAYFFLKVYCGSPRYKRAIQITGEPRYNLKGKKVGMVE
ncbi:MAG: ProQ/FINO family protein, partial [Vicingaceae bacterium]